MAGAANQHSTEQGNNISPERGRQDDGDDQTDRHHHCTMCEMLSVRGPDCGRDPWSLHSPRSSARYAGESALPAIRDASAI